MRNKWHISYNPYFVFPFLLWVIAGGILLMSYSAQTLFYTINSRFSGIADTLMYYITWIGEGWVITIVLAALFALPRFRNWWYFFSALLCNLLPFFMEQSLKSYYDSPRPLKVFHNAGWIHLADTWPKLYDRGFPSGHSEGAACFLCFLSLLLPARYKAAGLIFFILTIVVCYSRIYLAAHFFEDVYAGSITGVSTCIIIYTVINNVKENFSKKNTFIQ